MKRAGKITGFIFLGIFSLLVILAVVAALSENRIARIAFDQLAKTTDLPLKVDEIEFSLIRDFPYATLQCNNFLLTSPEINATGSRDTLAFVKRLYVSVNARPLLKSIFEIRRVEINEAELFYCVDTSGASNIDFLLDTTQQEIDTSANAIFLDLKDIKLQQVRFSYKDEQLKAKAELLINKLNMSGLIDKEDYRAKVEGTAALTNCSYDTTMLNLMQRTDLQFNLFYENGRLNLKELKVAMDKDLELWSAGNIQIGDTLFADLTFKTTIPDISGLLKYVPASDLNAYGITQAEGKLEADATVSGAISDSILPAVQVNFTFTGGKLKYGNYPLLQKIALTGEASNGSLRNNTTTVVDIQSASFQTAKSKVSVQGRIENPDKLTYNLRSNLNLDLSEFAPFIPDSLVHSVEGKLNASISTHGSVPDSVNDAAIRAILANTRASLTMNEVNLAIDSTLSLDSMAAQIDYLPGQIVVKNFKAKFPAYYASVQFPDATVTGDFLLPESLAIGFQGLTASSRSSRLELNGSLKNPFQPDYSVDGKIALHLKDIQEFIPDSMVNSIDGFVEATISSAARLNLDSLTDQLYPLIFEKSRFNLELENIQVAMPDSMMNVQHLSGKLAYAGDSLWIDRMDARYQGLKFGMKQVSIRNMYAAVFQNQSKVLDIQGDFHVDDLDYAFVEQFMEEDSASAPDETAESMNFTYKIRGNFSANSLKYEEALFQNVSSKFLVKDSYYVFDSLRLEAFGGQALSSIKVIMQPGDKMNLFFKTDVKKMDVAWLMRDFSEYLEYEDIKSDNVKGIASGKMDGEIVLLNYEPVYESLMLKGDLTIDNGALLHVKPVMEVEKIPGIGLKNMDKLYFSKLNSSLFLFNNELYIPKTEIRSTSFDAMFTGMYSFGEDYAYHIRMFLGEVLSSKSKANLRKQSEEGGFTADDEKDVTKGRTSIYVVSKSENGKEKAGFDNKRDRANMVARVNLQKQMVDMRFHPTLVNYKTNE